jgi:predicted DNA-binding transcriptional regulator YafY
MRADRLVAALLFLQSRGRVTAGELAAELEVSVATARRDLEALSTAGIPVYPQAGRGGGWALLGGSRTDLSGLTSGEAQALFLLVGPAASVAPEAKAALRKLVRALPGTFRADAEAAADAVVIDPARWGEPDRDPSPDLVELLQTAVVRRRQVRLSYRGRTGGQSERLVDPLGLIAKDDTWYLVAGSDRGRRTFRVDRIVDAVVTGTPAERPADFDLASAWDQVVDEVEQRRSLVSATVLVEARFVAVLRSQYGRHCEVAETVDDGRVRVRLAAPTPLMIAQPLAGWGSLIEVVDSEPVRAELVRLATEVLSRYRDTGTPTGGRATAGPVESAVAPPAAG